MSHVLVRKLLEKRGTVLDRNKMGVRKILYEDTKRVELTQECIVNGFEDKGSPATVAEIITALIIGVLTPLYCAGLCPCPGNRIKVCGS